MKIYFNASLAGKEEYLKEFKAILKVANKLADQVYADHVMKRNYRQVNKQTKKQHELDFQRARNMISKSDVMIVEATYPSIGVGHTMTIALEMYKPTLVLYRTTPHGLLIGDLNRLLTIKKYSLRNKKRLGQTIKTFLKKSKKKILKKRFNFMLDQTQDDYLNWISKRENISKANFIRMLIGKSTDENKEYK